MAFSDDKGDGRPDDAPSPTEALAIFREKEAKQKLALQQQNLTEEARKRARRQTGIAREAELRAKESELKAQAAAKKSRQLQRELKLARKELAEWRESATPSPEPTAASMDEPTTEEKTQLGYIQTSIEDLQGGSLTEAEFAREAWVHVKWLISSETSLVALSQLKALLQSCPYQGDEESTHTIVEILEKNLAKSGVLSMIKNTEEERITVNPEPPDSPVPLAAAAPVVPPGNADWIYVRGVLEDLPDTPVIKDRTTKEGIIAVLQSLTSPQMGVLLDNIRRRDAGLWVKTVTGNFGKRVSAVSPEPPAPSATKEDADREVVIKDTKLADEAHHQVTTGQRGMSNPMLARLGLGRHGKNRRKLGRGDHNVDKKLGSATKQRTPLSAPHSPTSSKVSAPPPPPPKKQDSQTVGWWQRRSRLTKGIVYTFLGAGVGAAIYFIQKAFKGSPVDTVLQLNTPLPAVPDTETLHPVAALLDAGATGLPVTLPANTILTFAGIPSESAIELGALSAVVTPGVDASSSSPVFGITLTADTPLEALAHQLAIEVENTLPVDGQGAITLNGLRLGNDKIVAIKGPEGAESLAVPYMSINDTPHAVVTMPSMASDVTSDMEIIQPFNSVALTVTDPDIGDVTRLAFVPSLHTESTPLPWQSPLPVMALESVHFVRINGDGTVGTQVGSSPFAGGTLEDTILTRYAHAAIEWDGSQFIGDHRALLDGWHVLHSGNHAVVISLDPAHRPAGMSLTDHTSLLAQYSKTPEVGSSEFLLMGNQQQIEATLSSWNTAPRDVHGLFSEQTPITGSTTVIDPQGATNTTASEALTTLRWTTGSPLKLEPTLSSTPYAHQFGSFDAPGTQSPDPNIYTLSIPVSETVRVSDVTPGRTDDWAHDFHFQDAYSNDTMSAAGWHEEAGFYRVSGRPTELSAALQAIPAPESLGRSGQMQATLPNMMLTDSAGNVVFVDTGSGRSDRVAPRDVVNYAVAAPALGMTVDQLNAAAQTDANPATLRIELDETVNGLDTCQLTGPRLTDGGLTATCGTINDHEMAVSLPQQAGKTGSTQSEAFTYTLSRVGDSDSAVSRTLPVSYTVAPTALPAFPVIDSVTQTIEPEGDFEPFDGLAAIRPTNIHDDYQLQVILAAGASTNSLSGWTPITDDAGVTTYTSPTLSADEMVTQLQRVEALTAQFAQHQYPSGDHIISANTNQVSLRNITPGTTLTGDEASITVDGAAGFTLRQPESTLTVTPPPTTPSIVDTGESHTAVALLNSAELMISAEGVNPLDSHVFKLDLGTARLRPNAPGSLPDYIRYDAAANTLTATIGPGNATQLQAGFNGLVTQPFDLVDYSAPFGATTQNLVLTHAINSGAERTLASVPVSLEIAASAHWHIEGNSTVVALNSTQTSGEGVAIFTQPFDSTDPNAHNLVDPIVTHPGAGVRYTETSLLGWQVDVSSNLKQTGLTLSQAEAALSALRVVSSNEDAGIPGSEVAVSAPTASIVYTGTDTPVAGGESFASAPIQVIAAALEISIDGCPDSSTPISNAAGHINLCPDIELIGGNTGTSYQITVAPNDIGVANFNGDILATSDWSLEGDNAIITVTDTAAAQAALRSLVANAPNGGAGAVGETKDAVFDITFQPLNSEGEPVGEALPTQTMHFTVEEADTPPVFTVQDHTFSIIGETQLIGNLIMLTDPDGGVPDGMKLEITFDLNPEEEGSGAIGFFAGRCAAGTSNPNSNTCINNGSNKALLLGGLAEEHGDPGWNTDITSLPTEGGYATAIKLDFTDSLADITAVQAALNQLTITPGTVGRLPADASTYPVTIQARLRDGADEILAESSIATLTFNSELTASRRLSADQRTPLFDTMFDEAGKCSSKLEVEPPS